MVSTENALLVVIILEFILAVYAVSLGIVSKNKVVKIINFVCAVIWVVMAVVNIINGTPA